MPPEDSYMGGLIPSVIWFDSNVVKGEAWGGDWGMRALSSPMESSINGFIYQWVLINGFIIGGFTTE